MWNLNLYADYTSLFSNGPKGSIDGISRTLDYFAYTCISGLRITVVRQKWFGYGVTKIFKRNNPLYKIESRLRVFKIWLVRNRILN